MAFIVGGLLIGAGATVVGGALSAKGSKDAAATADAGGERDIAFQDKWATIARDDQKQAREAGGVALSALMDMTGLSGIGGASAGSRPSNNYGGDVSNVGTRNVIEGGYGYGAGSGGSSYGGIKRAGEGILGMRTALRYAGGPISPGTVYNVNEMGPENIYRNGTYTRGHGPATIDGSTGYVEPNTEGRAEGGMMGGMYDNKTYPARPQNTANSTAINPATGYPTENPGGREGGYSFMTDPGYQFRFEEGQRAIDRSASASGHSLSGGAVRKAIRYGQGAASAEYGNVYNRISNIAGLGSVANNSSGNYAMMAGQGMGNSASNAANASAYGQINAGNAWANAGNEIARLPWAKGFGGQQDQTLKQTTGGFVY